jgi:hypothetical protein
MKTARQRYGFMTRPHLKPSAKNAEDETRPYTRDDFMQLLRKVSTTPFQQPLPKIA